MERTIRCQPSTNTKSNILKGMETIIGGSIIIPIDIKVTETTISITKNGMYITNPMVNAVLSSLIRNAGTTTPMLRSAFVLGLGERDRFTNSAISFVRVCLSIKSFSGPVAFSVALSNDILCSIYGRNAL